MAAPPRDSRVATDAAAIDVVAITVLEADAEAA
jgi:hypothetical protein